MATLKKGSKGPEVKVLQQRLLDHGFSPGLIDGDFGAATELAVKNFQLFKQLDADGIVGPITLAALTSDGGEPDQTVVPRKPRSYSEVITIFGDPRTNADAFEAKYLAFCALPDAFTVFPKVQGKHGFTTHKLLIPVFQKVFSEIEAAGLVDKIYSFDGCWNVRKISGSSNYSLHSWAIAIDLNYVGNELGDTTPAMNKGVIAIFKKNGFFWGGDYTGRKDPMHFEWYDRS